MKKPAYLSRRLACLVVLALAAVAVGCSKDITSNEPLPPLTPVAADANAGSWRMIFLTGPTQVDVPAPVATTDPGYQSELAAIRQAQGALTTEQRAAIQEWSGSGVLRWNQIMRELVARADLPPAPNPDGSYPVPDPANPFADPRFPFSNPPYAARAYSYVAVAQYEALKAAWHYKFQYNRPSPHDVDSGIQALMPATGVPAYPSEDAVVSSVNEVLLKLLFPTSAEQIAAEAAQQRQAALISGRASASDIAAGTALGEAVANIFKARAGTDGMRTAGGNAALWKAMEEAAVARGEVPWKSQETPARPPMLPAFGGVMTWLMTPSELATERPGPPPSTSSAQMREELAEVKRAVDNLTREQLAIVYKWADGVSTPTPPGHWNAIAVPFISRARYSEVRAARALALINATMHDAAVACWDAKMAYYNPRPSQLDPSIKTVIGLPNFPSYVSGHSTFSASSAAVLSYLFPEGAAEFDAQKEEAAISRLYGGIHYRSDIEIGKSHGKRIGDYAVRFAQTDGADQTAPQ